MNLVMFFSAGAGAEISAAISSGTMIAASLFITCSSVSQLNLEFPRFQERKFPRNPISLSNQTSSGMGRLVGDPRPHLPGLRSH